MLINITLILLSSLVNVDLFSIYQSTDWKQLADLLSFFRELIGLAREMYVIALPILPWFLKRKLRWWKDDVTIEEKVEEKEKDDNPNKDHHL